MCCDARLGKRSHTGRITVRALRHAAWMAMLFPIYAQAGAPSADGMVVETLRDTIELENQDRIHRFDRLPRPANTRLPTVEEIVVPAGVVSGADYPIPVARVRFDERVFFDFNKDVIRTDATDTLDLLAENMRRDVPDARLTILGHTDAIGTNEYNFDLSARRARSVMQALYVRGVRLAQMSTVAVGKTQPTASNMTDEGRALNRRVEFMISASEQANLTLVSRRRVICDYLAVEKEPATVDHCSVEAGDLPSGLPVQKPQPVPVHPTGPTPDQIHLAPVDIIPLQKPITEGELQHIAPLPPPDITPPVDVHRAQLRREFDL